MSLTSFDLWRYGEPVVGFDFRRGKSDVDTQTLLYTIFDMVRGQIFQNWLGGVNPQLLSVQRELLWWRFLGVASVAFVYNRRYVTQT